MWDIHGVSACLVCLLTRNGYVFHLNEGSEDLYNYEYNYGNSAIINGHLRLCVGSYSCTTYSRICLQGALYGEDTFWPRHTFLNLSCLWHFIFILKESPQTDFTVLVKLYMYNTSEFYIKFDMLFKHSFFSGFSLVKLYFLAYRMTSFFLCFAWFAYK